MFQSAPTSISTSEKTFLLVPDSKDRAIAPDLRHRRDLAIGVVLQEARRHRGGLQGPVHLQDLRSGNQGGWMGKFIGKPWENEMIMGKIMGKLLCSMVFIGKIHGKTMGK